MKLTEAERFLRLLWKVGEVREVRVLKHNRFGHNASGYFENPESLIAAAARFDGKANIFVTINPVRPALLARAAHRIVDRAEHTTADADVLQRCAVFVDCDPVRPAGISSSAEELAAAHEVIQAVVGWLRERGWPEPIVVMSGNGYYLVFAIDLPNDDPATVLIERVLAALASRFNTDAAHIDTSVSNAARLIGLVGTMKVKGDEVPDRPHRRSCVESAPRDVIPVSNEQLSDVADELPPIEERAGDGGSRGSLAALLDEHGVDYRAQPPDARGITWLHVRQCPLHDDGKPFECGVGQKLPAGPVAAHCFHPEGKGKKWRDWALALGIDAVVSPSPATGLDRYEETPDGLVWLKPTASGEVPTRLTNWTARIVGDVVEDDGAEERRYFDIEARIQTVVRRFHVPHSQYANLNWAIEHLGVQAIVRPGTMIRSHVAVAIQSMSLSAERRTVYTHTGWRRHGGEPVFLHAGGAIAADGLARPVEVRLGDRLDRFALPTNTTSELMTAGVRSSLALLDLAPIDVMAPILAATYLSVLRELLGPVPPDFVVFLVGPTGAFKTEAAVLGQAHFGPFSRVSLVASFQSTANYIERLLFALKDVLTVVDDFHPTDDRHSEAAMIQVMARLLRSAGNNAARGRMNADTSLRPDLHPRGTVIATGERLPPGHSNSARMSTVNVPRGAVDVGRLSAAQADAHLLPHGMVAFIRYVAANFDRLTERLPERFRQLRALAAKAVNGHAREPGQVAHLFLALETWLEFAVHAGVMGESEAEARLAASWEAILGLAAEQSVELAGLTPVARFLALLSDGFASKAIYLEDRNGDAPAEAGSWGWQVGPGPEQADVETRRTQPPIKGIPVGRLDDDWILLLPEVTYGYVVATASRAGQPFPADQRTLLRRLDEAGLIDVDVEGDRRRRTLNVRFGSRTQRVIKLRRSALEDSASPRQPKAGVPRACSPSAAFGGNGRSLHADSDEGDVPRVPHVPTSDGGREVAEI